MPLFLHVQKACFLMRQLLLFSDNSDLTLKIDKAGMKAEPLNYEGFAMMWSGARGTYGVNKGKVAFEVKVCYSFDHFCKI